MDTLSEHSIDLYPFHVAEVVIPTSIPKILAYKIPSNFRKKAQIGALVEVSFRSKKIFGFVLNLVEERKYKDIPLKDILSFPFETPFFTKHDLEFYNWITEYYQLPLGDVLRCAFPKTVLKNIQETTKDLQDANPLTVTVPAGPATVNPQFTLTCDQKKALTQILEALKIGQFKSFLLFGITGSGKTEVYIQAAKEALSQNKSALILVPEIALTPQLQKRFEERFSGEVAILHSGLSNKIRRQYWWDIFNGRKKLVVGARSALFAPLQKIGLIVVDEEHEPSYKQGDHLRYHARDLALVRSKLHQAITILGSATPAIETFYTAQMSKHTLLTLQNRPNAQVLPQIQVVDLKNEKDNFIFSKTLFSEPLKQGLADTLKRNEQAILYVNRKGYANFLLCSDCGHVPQCLNCSVSLTYYSSSKALKCHYCNLTKNTPDTCPKCTSYKLRFMGLGTERVEQELKMLFPETKVSRLDADAISSSKILEKTLDLFRKGETQILVGTQILAKGHDFPNVTFVGIVFADFNLHLPDFRASERTFQLLTQVSGRAGRGGKKGSVVLQTFLPNHYSIQSASEHNYEEFYKHELQYRKEFGYPPFSRIARLEFRHLKEEKTMQQAKRAEQILSSLGAHSKNFTYLGPAPATVLKISNQYRWHILVKSEKFAALNAVLKTLRKEGVRFIDVDPISTI